MERIRERYGSDYFHDEYLPECGVIDGRVDDGEIRRRFASKVAGLAPWRRSGAILDVGAGAGLFLHAARMEGWEVEGVEISEAAVAFAGEKLGIVLRHGELRDFDLPEGRYDVVTLHETIEHLTDPMADLRRVVPLLRKGGAVMITTPNEGGLARALLGEEWSPVSPAEHLFLFRVATLKAMLETAGLTVASIGTTGCASPSVHRATVRTIAARPLLLAATLLLPWLLRRARLGDTLVATAVKP
jgi:2-polyprenyl-3-methyl-5-hydroxy-6-metoxy-1,4-benzoquinol methylase